MKWTKQKWWILQSSLNKTKEVKINFRKGFSMITLITILSKKIISTMWSETLKFLNNNLKNSEGLWTSERTVDKLLKTNNNSSSKSNKKNRNFNLIDKFIRKWMRSCSTMIILNNSDKIMISSLNKSLERISLIFKTQIWFKTTN